MGRSEKWFEGMGPPRFGVERGPKREWKTVRSSDGENSRAIHPDFAPSNSPRLDRELPSDCVEVGR